MLHQNDLKGGFDKENNTGTENGCTGGFMVLQVEMIDLFKSAQSKGGCAVWETLTMPKMAAVVTRGLRVAIEGN